MTDHSNTSSSFWLKAHDMAPAAARPRLVGQLARAEANREGLAATEIQFGLARLFININAPHWGAPALEISAAGTTLSPSEAAAYARDMAACAACAEALAAILAGA
jgi:hypothetical protein